MSDPKDGPWDEATAHDDSRPFDDEQMDGEDPPTTRATLAQQVRVRAASRTPAVGAAATKPREAGSTLPPPSSPERLPAHTPGAPTGATTTAHATGATTSTPHAPGGSATPARPNLAAAPAATWRLDDELTPVALPAVQDANIRKSREAGPHIELAPTSGHAPGGLVVVATGADAERVRKLCHGSGLHVNVVASTSAAEGATSVIVLGDPALPPPPRVVHFARVALADEDLLDLMRSHVAGRAVADPPVAALDTEPRVAEFAARIAAISDRAALETFAIEAVTALTGADRVRVLFFDVATGTLVRETTGEQHRAVAGLVGWCAYTGRAVHASPAGDDARYLTELDDPEGKGQTRLLVQPVIGTDHRTRVVLVAVRRWRRTDFVDAERTTLAALAARLAPTADALASGGATRTRTTQQGIVAVRPGTDPATQSALVSPPRTASDSRPPPVTARRADSKPPPPGDATLAAGSVTAGSVTATPTAGSPSVTTTPAAGSPSVTASPAAGSPSVTATPVAGSAHPRAASEGGRPRSHSDSPATRSVRRAPDVTDPLDVAIVATAEDDIARIKRIARKARLEVSTLSRAEDAPPYYRIVTLGEAWTPDTDARVAYAARSSITDDQLAELLVGIAHDRAPASLVATKPQSSAEAKRVQVAFASSRKLAGSTDLAESETLTIEAVRELLDADRAYCLYYSNEDGSLWSETRRRARGDDRRAIAGVVGWAARSGLAANIPRASADPRWLGPLDDPDGDMHSQLLAQPVIATDRRVLGVIVAARRTKRPPFTELDVGLLERFAALASPLLEQLQLASVTQHMLHESSAPHDIPALDSPIQSLARRVRALPRWSYAAGGAALMLAIVLLATSC